MSSPFQMFRRHQRVLMVVVTGLAMISFVLLGAIDDPRNTPTTLIILFLAALAGGIAWLAGLNSGKASEWGLSGVVLGAVIGLVLAFSSRESAAVQIDSGNLTQQELSLLRRQRYIANNFVRQAFMRTGTQGQRNQIELMFFLPQYLFGVNLRSDEVTTEDIVLAELFRRKADEMGLVISDQVVMDFIKEVTGDRMTRELFSTIRGQLQVSESQLMSALREELKAKQAFRLLYPDQYRMLYEPMTSTAELPPEAYWDFHRKLNVRQSAEVVGVPVSRFIDEQAEPSPSELQELFAQYRNNIPNFTADGRPDEGRPGFFQPRRIQIGYLEAVYDEIEPLVEEPTDEEIQARYEAEYKRSLPLDDDGPMLPPQLKLPADDAPQSTPDDQPAAPPGTPDAPKKPAEALPESSEKPEDDANKDKPAAPVDSSDPEAPTGNDGNNSSSRLIHSATQFVALLQDDPSAAPAAEEKPVAEPAAEKPPTDADKPAAEAPEKPAETPEKPADAPEKTTEAPDTPADDPLVPPAPSLSVRPLDDELKLQIRDDLLRERTQERIRELVAAGYDEMTRLGLNLQLSPDHPDHLTLDHARTQLRKFAEEKSLVYVETPFLSYQELRETDDYPIGRAETTLGQRQPVADALFQMPSSDLFRVSQAINAFTDSGFAFWKLGDRAAYAPETIEEELVREQVVTAWRQQQARPKAEERATQLADLVRDSELPMSETLAEVTVTGQADDLLVDVRETGSFTWLTRSSAAPTSLGQTGPVRPSVIPGVEDAGQRFFETVFDRLQPGDVGIAPSRDGSVLYVVRIKERRPSTPEELDRMRQNFLSTAATNGFSGLSRQSLGDFSVNWVERLFEQHNVRIVEY